MWLGSQSNIIKDSTMQEKGIILIGIEERLIKIRFHNAVTFTDVAGAGINNKMCV